MVIVQHFSGSVKQYIAAVPFPGRTFALPDRCPHPACHAADSLIRWGTYQRWACTAGTAYLMRVQRIRCKVCGCTHSLLPDFLHPYRHYVIRLLQNVIYLYLIAGLGLGRLLRQMPEPGPARSTVREWIRSFAYGAGHLLLGVLQRLLLTLDPGIEMPDSSPEHLNDVPDPLKRRRLEKAHAFWLLAENLYAQIKNRQPDLHFTAREFFPFLLHWLQSQQLPPRLFWSPLLPTTPTEPF